MKRAPLHLADDQLNLARSTVVGHIDRDHQEEVLLAVRDIIRLAPLRYPSAFGAPMSVKVSNAGPVGWWGDRSGYRYIDRQPVCQQTGYPDLRSSRPWPPVPSTLLDLFRRFSSDTREIVAHIVWYEPGASLGDHIDKTEAHLDGDVVSISIGDPAVWCVIDEDGSRHRTTLYSGDVTRLHGSSRLWMHAIERVDACGSLLHPSPLHHPGRLAVTLRSGAV